MTASHIRIGCQTLAHSIGRKKTALNNYKPDISELN